jgi:hypothetical protein
MAPLSDPEPRDTYTEFSLAGIEPSNFADCLRQTWERMTAHMHYEHLEGQFVHFVLLLCQTITE